MHSIRPDQYYTDVIAKPIVRKSTNNRDVEITAEDEQQFLLRYTISFQNCIGGKVKKHECFSGSNNIYNNKAFRPLEVHHQPESLMEFKKHQIETLSVHQEWVAVLER